jgi:hypothetical protein
LGALLGQALVQGCEVFEGTVVKVSLPSADEETKELILRDLDVKVDQALHGTNLKKGDVVRVAHASGGFPIKARPPIALRAWSGIEPKKDQRLLLARWPEGSPKRRRFGNLEDAVFVVATDRTMIGRLISLVQRHQRYTKNYKEVVRGFWFVHDAIDLNDPLFASYLVAFLGTGRGGNDVESWEYSILALCALLGEEQLGQHDRIHIANQVLPFAYDNLSADAKKTALQNLIRAATDADKEVVYNSLLTLGKLVKSGADVKSLLDEGTRDKLQASYKEWVGKRQFDREWSRPFADQLDLK